MVFPSSLAFISFFLFFVSFAIFFILPLYGHVLTIGSVHLNSLKSVRYIRARSSTISASSVKFQFHIPSPRAPYWAKFYAQNYRYQDVKSAVMIAEIEGTLWFFPVLFRFTAGPILTLKFDDFRLQVYNSNCTPPWVRQLRDNLIYTIINEETVRLHQFKSRFALNGLIGTAGRNTGFDELDKPWLEPDQDLDEVKIQGKAQQWHVHNTRNNRMYTFDVLQAELRESWIEGRQSLVIIAHNSKWTKLPVVGQNTDVSVFRYLCLALIHAPKQLLSMIQYPLSVIEMDVLRCDITFCKFHLKDGALVEQGSVLARQQYDKSKSHGSLNDACIDSLVQALMSLYDQGN